MDPGTMTRLAIIPARGGSIRLPRKNILPLEKKPMICYPIEASLESNLFDQVLVSTDDEEIADIASDSGAHIIHRPPHLADYQTTVVEVCESTLSLACYRDIEIFCCIYATSVFLTAAHLVESFAMLSDTPPADYVMGVSRNNFHPARSLRSEGDYLAPMWPSLSSRQSQDLPELVVGNGTLYWARTTAFLDDHTFYGNRLKGYFLETVDIDTQNDYDAVRSFFRTTRDSRFR